MPAAYVIPVSIKAGDNQNQTGLTQDITCTFQVIVAMDNSIDARGQSTSTIEFKQMFVAMNLALLNWNIDPAAAPRTLQLDQVALQSQDRARQFFSFEYSYETNITDKDGFPVTGLPLENVFMTLDGITSDIALDQV